MNIKTRLSLHFTLLVAVILFFLSTLIYYLSYTSQRDRFRSNLLYRAKNSATLLVNFQEIDGSLLRELHQATLRYDDEEIVITDSAYNVIYSFNNTFLNDSVVKSYSGSESYRFFHIKGKDGINFLHEFNNQTYYVSLMASDNLGKEYLSDLRKAFLWSIIFSLLLSVLASYLFSKIAVQPLSQIIKKIRGVHPTRLSDRINVGGRKDEIGQLAFSFNEMLSNIEDAFKKQEEFVSNASHELRTPLAVMVAEADYLLNKPRSNEEYQNYVKDTVAELRKLNSLLYTLLELAQINRDNAVQLTGVRIDEIIYLAVYQVKIKNQGRKILTKIQYPENENDLIVNGNPGLLEIVFINLLDNACKFSTDEILIEISITEKAICIEISDKGIGIPVSEVENIFKPFNRATNARLKSGFGIGLYLVYTIVKLHSADIKVSSIENEGTRFELIFNRGLERENSQPLH
jgi:signal transduction histidine kinase